MSYHRTAGLLDDAASWFSQAKSAVDKIKPVVAAAEQVLGDPALPEVTSLVMRLREIEKRRTAGRPGGGGRPEPGIGLRHAVTPLRAFVTYREKPLIGWLIVGAIIGVPFLVGMKFGRKKR